MVRGAGVFGRSREGSPPSAKKDMFVLYPTYADERERSTALSCPARCFVYHRTAVLLELNSVSLLYTR